MNNLPKVVTQQRRGRASNPRLSDRKSDALPQSHRATVMRFIIFNKVQCMYVCPFVTSCMYRNAVMVYVVIRNRLRTVVIQPKVTVLRLVLCCSGMEARLLHDWHHPVWRWFRRRQSEHQSTGSTAGSSWVRATDDPVDLTQLTA